MGKTYRLEDLPPYLQDQARAQLGQAQAPAAQAIDTRPGPNKTEAAYRARYLAGLDARYEALTFRLSNGHRYTPDWVVFEYGRPVECHEVKGAYRFASHGRSRLAFDQARVEFPGLRWCWNGELVGRPSPLGTLRGGPGLQGRDAPSVRKNDSETEG